jgi:hypothetical protein
MSFSYFLGWEETGVHFFCLLLILHFDYISDGVWEIIGCLVDFAVLGRSFVKAFVAFSFLPVLLKY